MILKLFLVDFFHNLETCWFLLGTFIAFWIALFICRKQIKANYNLKILKIIEKILHNFRIQPSFFLIPPVVLSQYIDKNFSKLFPNDPYVISGIIAQCSMGCPLTLKDLLQSKNQTDDHDHQWLIGYQKGLIALYSITMISMQAPSVTKNWINGRVQYNPDIKTIKRNDLMRWLNNYQKVMSGLEFAWLNNRSNLWDYISDFFVYIKINKTEYIPNSDNILANIQCDLHNYFKLMYKNLALCEELRFLLQEENKLSYKYLISLGYKS